MSKVKSPYFWVVLVTIMGWVFHRPDLLISNEIPVTGDTIGHVWAAELFNQHIWSSGPLFWDNSWYSGLPFFRYYMIPPFFLISVLHAGGMVASAFGVMITALWTGLKYKTGSLTKPVVVVALAAGLLVALPVPFYVAFKIVWFSAFLFLPAAVWFAARSFRSQVNPDLVLLASLLFVYSTGFFVEGGNALGALVGEFSFGIALTTCFIAFGFYTKPDRSRQDLVLAMCVGGFTILSHIIVFIFLTIMISSYIIANVLEDRERRWGSLVVASGILGVFSTGFGMQTVYASLVLFGAVMLRTKLRELATAHFLALTPMVLLSAWWVVPFVLTEHSVSNPDWPKFGLLHAGGGIFWLILPAGWSIMVWVLAKESDKFSSTWASVLLISTLVFFGLPPDAFWNGRILPIMYLSSTMLVVSVVNAFYVESKIKTTIQQDTEPSSVQQAKPQTSGLAKLSAVGFLFLLLQGLHLTIGSTTTAFNGFREENADEYHDLTVMLQSTVESNGCGTLRWEAFISDDAMRYGSYFTMAYLPHYTNGCIGTSTGLYTESSSTSPFHIFNAYSSSVDALTIRLEEDAPAANLKLAVTQMRALGTKYYMSQSAEMTYQAEALVESGELVFVDETEVWRLYELTDWSLVEKVSVSNLVHTTGDYPEWRDTQLEEFNKNGLSGTLSVLGEQDLIPQQETTSEQFPVVVADGNTITVTDAGTVPLLIKVSWHDNWVAEGGVGPFPAGANMMLVYPDETGTVVLSHVVYGWEKALMWLSGLTLLLLGVFALKMDRKE